MRQQLQALKKETQNLLEEIQEKRGEQVETPKKERKCENHLKKYRRTWFIRQESLKRKQQKFP